PVVAILATGDELGALGQPLAPGQIYNSNTYSLASQVVEAGGVPNILGIARDRATELKDKIKQGLEADLVITSGGVSQGDYDLVKEVLAEEGEISFWTVRMKPGKPLAFGYFLKNGRRIPHLGLPGNPVSSMITFELFARPLIIKMRGKRTWARNTVEATMEDSLVNRDGRRVYARVRLIRRGEQYYARLTGEQGSAILTSMVQAQGLAIIPEVVSEVRPGDQVRVMLLTRAGG
ncbi:MAG: molybdopterin molybdotransferase MoeA, partial [Chloroflexota bacterium]